MEISLAVVGAKLIDGLDSSPIPSSVVLVEKSGRIVAVGQTGELAVPEGIRTIEAAGMVLMPGLIDGHVHLTWDKTLYAVHAAGQHLESLNDPERHLVRAGHYAQTALAAGITTLRDCGANNFSVLALRDMIDAGNFVGPRILASGKPVTTTAGHLYTDWGVDSVLEMKKAVRFLASNGVDFIKLIASGGTTTPRSNITRSQYTLQELSSAVNEAHRLGLQVATHAISTDSIRLVAEAGVDTIEHCSWIGNDPKTIVTDERAVELMLESDVRVDHAIIPRLYLFPDENEETLSAEDEWWLNMLKVRWPFLHHMQEEGVTVFLGSDAAFGPWPGTGAWPGFQDLARAVEIMVRWAGFTPMEAIAMVTREAAKALCLDTEIGTVEKGKRADLILLTEDPLADIRALREVAAVFRDGRIVANQGQVVVTGVQPTATAPRGWELPV
ncbi:MAG: amidohydrolase family protein [bacterium]